MRNSTPQMSGRGSLDRTCAYTSLGSQFPLSPIRMSRNGGIGTLAGGFPFGLPLNHEEICLMSSLYCATSGLLIDLHSPGDLPCGGIRVLHRVFLRCFDLQRCTLLMIIF